MADFLGITKRKWLAFGIFSALPAILLCLVRHPLEAMAFFLFSIIVLILCNITIGAVISLSKLGKMARYLISVLVVAAVSLILWNSPMSMFWSFELLLSGALTAGIFMLPLFVPNMQKRYLAALLALGASFLYTTYYRNVVVGPRIPGPLEMLAGDAIFWGALLLIYVLSDIIAGITLGFISKSKSKKNKSK